MKPIKDRLQEHRTTFRSNNQTNAMVEHTKSHPGHKFDLSKARLIWNTDDKYESKLVEASCIKKFNHCNLSEGEARVTDIISSFFTRITGIRTPGILPPRQPHSSSTLYVTRTFSQQTPTTSTPASADITNPTTPLSSPPPSRTPNISPVSTRHDSLSPRQDTASSQPSLHTPTIDLPLHPISESQPVNFRHPISGQQRSLDSPMALRPRPSLRTRKDNH